MYEIIFSDLAKKQFSKLQKELQKRISLVLERIKIRPQSYVKKLVGDPGFSLRVGDYRIIMDIYRDKLMILVIKIEHRKKVYQKH